MTTITLILEDDEQFALRAIMRQMELMIPDAMEGEDDTMVHTLMKKIIEATSSLSPEWKKEVAKMQRAVRKAKGTPEYVQALQAMQALALLLQEKIKEEEAGEVITAQVLEKEVPLPPMPENFNVSYWGKIPRLEAKT